MRDVGAVAQRLEMVRRIANEIDDYVVELGTDGRLLALQLDELVAGVDDDRELIVRDYAPGGREAPSPKRCSPSWRRSRRPSWSTSPGSARALGLGAPRTSTAR